MKKIALAFLTLIITIPAFGAPKTYADTEQKYIFTAENLAETIPDFVTDVAKQTAVAKKYIALMNPENGAVSIADLFAICRAGGFNTYRVTGFETCRNFVVALLNNTGNEVDENALGGYCPGLDENGRNPNKLASITDKTRVGDLCTSSHIAMGEVVFQRNNSYSCTCLALACNGDYDLRGGACNTPIPVGTPTCARSIHKEDASNNTTAKCLDFCKAKATRENCALTDVVMRHSTTECICNANSSEVEAAKESMVRAAQRKAEQEAKLKAEQEANRKYYEVCGKDKGKTGKKEYCIENVFNWKNLQRMQAVAIAQEYARVRHNTSIVCDNKHRTSWNDDYIKCTATDNSAFYEFKFDDVKESIDGTIDSAVMGSICTGIYGGRGTRECSGISPALCTSIFATTANKFGYDTEFRDGKCVFVSMRKDSGNKIKEIPGIDSYRFYSGDIQIQALSDMTSTLCGYIKSVKSGVSTCSCVQHPDHMAQIDGHTVQGKSDDVIRCTFNGNQDVDFVFDDTSELFDYVSEKGHSGIQCIISGGKFTGAKCHGLNKQQCIDAGKKLKQTVPGSSGTRWDGKNCVLIDGEEAETYDGAIYIAAGLVGAVDCAIGTHVGCVLFMVEASSLTLEMTTGAAIKGRADDFLSVSTKCHQRSCALNAIRDLGGKVASVQGKLGQSASRSVDEELARLIGYLEPKDLGTLLGTNDVAAVIRQLGGNPDDWGGRLLRWGNTIGLIGQFASLGASGLRLTGRAIARVAGAESRLGTSATKMANLLETSKKTVRGADTASDTARAASRADDVSDVAKAERAVANADDVSDVVRGTDNVSDGLRNARNMTADQELEMVGVRDLGNGQYRDIRTGRYVSHEDVLKRIDDLSYETERVTAHADDVARAASRADDAEREAQRLAENARVRANTPTESQLDDIIAMGMRNKAAREADVAERQAANAASRADDAEREAQRLAENARVRANTPTESQLDDIIAMGMRNKAAREAEVAERQVAVAERQTTNAMNRSEPWYPELKKRMNMEKLSDAPQGWELKLREEVLKVADSNEPVAVRQGTIVMDPQDEKFILEAIEKRWKGTLAPAEHRQAARTLAKYFDANAAERYALQMRSDLIEAMKQDNLEVVYRFFDPEGGPDAFAEFIINKLGPKYGIPQGKLKWMITSRQPGYAGYSDGVIRLNSNIGDLDLDRAINLITHEFAHAIDDLAPQYGVIGRKLDVYSGLGGLYPDGLGEIYKLIPNEQGAHMIGDIVSGKTNYGTTQYRNMKSISKELVDLLGE